MGDGASDLYERQPPDIEPYLWGLDYSDGWPWRVHAVVRITGEKPHRTYHMACGETRDEGTRGCWSTPEPENPIPKLACPDCDRPPAPLADRER